MRFLRDVIIGIAVLGSLMCMTSCSGDNEEAEAIIRPVRFQPVYATGGDRLREFSGAAKAGQESQLSFKVAGTISRVAVKVGDRVRAGNTIAVLDSQDHELQVQAAQASLEQARAQARNASADYDRVRGLYENNNASRNDLDAARAGSESAEAAVRAAEKSLELSELQLAYCTLKAPVAGAIAAVSVEVNENVTVGKSVALLTSGARHEVEVAVPEILISQIREGDHVEVAFDAIPSESFNATITEVGVASTGLVTTFPVTMVLDRASDEIRPGMAAQVAFRFESSDQRERYVVPSVAVGEDRTGRFVFTVTPSDNGFGVVKRQAVTIGDLTADGLEIFEGLSDGDLLVTAGISKIVDGQTVRLPDAGGSQS